VKVAFHSSGVQVLRSKFRPVGHILNVVDILDQHELLFSAKDLSCELVSEILGRGTVVPIRHEKLPEHTHIWDFKEKALVIHVINLQGILSIL